MLIYLFINIPLQNINIVIYLYLFGNIMFGILNKKMKRKKFVSERLRIKIISETGINDII